MVMARTFRGPDADKFALALTKELRQDYGLPACILRTERLPDAEQHPGRPPDGRPRAPEIGQLAFPEKVRSYDEAVVLVGNEKTLADQEKLWH